MALDTARTVATLRGLTAKFDLGTSDASPFYPTLCTIAPSRGSDEKYGFLGAMPGMQEWLSDRDFQSLRGADYTLANKTWESSVVIEKEDIEDDRIGMYGPSLQMLGQEAAHHPDELLLTALTAGTSTACFDGQFFFDTDHSWGDSGSQSNDISKAIVAKDAVTEAEFRTAYHAARAAMLGYKNDQGKLFIRPTIRPMPSLMLMVPPEMEESANQAINKTFVSSGETNIVLDKPMIVANGGLTATDAFYLFNLSQPLKPFVFQARRPLARQMKGMDDREFKNVKFMTDARYNLGYLAWWNAVLTTFTTA